MALDPKSFIDWLPEEDQTAVLALFGKHPDAVSRLEAKVTAAIDSQMAPIRADYETKRRDLDAQFETIDSIRGADGKILDTFKAQAEKSVAALAVAQQRIRTACADAGLDPEPYLKDLDAPIVKPEAKVESQTFDSKQIMQQAGVAAFNALAASLEAQDIAQEHQKLFGEPLTNSTGLLRELQDRVRRTGNDKISLRDVWQETYKVDAKRSEITERSVQTRIDQAVEKARIEERDKQALITPESKPGTFAGSPLLAELAPKDRPVHTAGLPEGVLASIASYNKSRNAA